MITLIVGGVAVSDVLIDSGATCNMVGQQSWEMLKLKGINCESVCEVGQRAFYLRWYGTFTDSWNFTADVWLTGNYRGCRADFVVVQGDGRMLLGCETVDILNLLHIGPFQVNNVDSGGLESCVREKYKALFTGVGPLKGYELKLHIDESVTPVAQPVRRILFGLQEKVARST